MSILVVKLTTDDIPLNKIVEFFQDFDPYSSSFILGNSSPLYDVEALKRAVEVTALEDVRIEEKIQNQPWARAHKHKNDFKKRCK